MTLRPRYIPELQELRKGAPQNVAPTPFPPPGATGLHPLAGVSGAQLEISATIKFGSASASASGGEFGLAVLSGEVDGVAEHTKIGFNLTAVFSSNVAVDAAGLHGGAHVTIVLRAGRHYTPGIVLSEVHSGLTI